MSEQPLDPAPFTLNPDRRTRVLLAMLNDVLHDEPPEVGDADNYTAATHLELACYRRLRWEQMRDGLSLAVGQVLVYQALETIPDDA